MKKFYAIILGITAVLLAVTAAYFSVFGLSKLFIGASLSVIIMTGTLEFSKLVIVSLLHQYWDKLAKLLKTYLLIGTIILMIITSAGIYGFLSSAYSKVSTELDKMGGGIELLEKKIEIKKEEKLRLTEQIKTKNERAITLTDLRKSQETRLDSLYQKGWIAAAKKTETVIKQADDNIFTINQEITTISSKVESLNDSISKYETVKLEAGNNDIASEIGPLKYISKLTGASMDKVVNYLILLLIIVFDPLAVALVIATSSMINMRKEEQEEQKNKAEESVKSLVNKFKKNVEYVSDEKGNFKLKNEEEVKPTEIIEELIEENVEELKVEDNTEQNIVSEIVEVLKESSNFNVSDNMIVPGVFTATTSNNESIIGNLYIQLLDIFFDGGNKTKEQEIPKYTEFKNSIELKFPNIKEKEIKDFLLVCNLVKIIYFKDEIYYFQKSYEDAKLIWLLTDKQGKKHSVEIQFNLLNNRNEEHFSHHRIYKMKAIIEAIVRLQWCIRRTHIEKLIHIMLEEHKEITQKEQPGKFPELLYLGWNTDPENTEIAEKAIYDHFVQEWVILELKLPNTNTRRVCTTKKSRNRFHQKEEYELMYPENTEISRKWEWHTDYID